MAAMRLTDKHPAYQALEEVFDFMKEKGVCLQFGTNGELYYNYEGKQYELRDVEHDGFYRTAGVSELPPVLEYKIIIEDF